MREMLDCLSSDKRERFKLLNLNKFGCSQKKKSQRNCSLQTFLKSNSLESVCLKVKCIQLPPILIPLHLSTLWPMKGQFNKNKTLQFGIYSLFITYGWLIPCKSLNKLNKNTAGVSNIKILASSFRCARCP